MIKAIHEWLQGDSKIAWNRSETTSMRRLVWRRINRRKRAACKIFRKCLAHPKLSLLILTSSTFVLTLLLTSFFAIPFTEWVPRSKLAAERCFLQTAGVKPLPFHDDLPWSCDVHNDVSSDVSRLWQVNPKLHCCYQSVSMSKSYLLLPDNDGRGWRLPVGGVDAADNGYDLVLASCDGAHKSTLHFFPPQTLAQAAVDGVVSVVVLKTRGQDMHSLMATWSILRKADAVHMDAYTQLGSSVDDRPDVLATLTGVPEFDFPSWCLQNSDTNCPWIWQRFAAAGAATLLLEEFPCVGDFATRPTDVWLRPLVKLMNDALREFDPGGECPTSTLKAKWLGRYLRAALGAVTRGVGPYWAMVYATATDAFDAEFAGALNDVLKRAVVFLVADRRLSVAVPKWFRLAYPAAMVNLRNNKRRHTTPFDVHETMVHLSDFRRLAELSSASKGAELKADVPGRSLFLPVPEWASKDEEPSFPSEQQVRLTASALVSLLNRRLARKNVSCNPLSVRRVVSAETLGSDLLLVAETAPVGVVVQALMGLGDHEPGSVSLKSVVPADLDALCHFTTPKDAKL